MGGLYIPDVNLPGDGEFELWMEIKKDGSFTYFINGKWRNGKRKVIPIPPHGRCVDADALKVSLTFAKETAEWAVPALKAVLMIIDEMPTIIPADPEEEDK